MFIKCISYKLLCLTLLIIMNIPSKRDVLGMVCAALKIKCYGHD